MTRVPPHMRCGAKQKARHAHNRRIMNRLKFEYEPDMLKDIEYPKNEPELEYKQQLLVKIQ